MAKKVRTQILLEPRQVEMLKKKSAETGAPMGEIVRRAVDAYFAKKPTKSKPRR